MSALKSLMACEAALTQAQRPGARDATIATATLSPGSLQRMVRPRCHRKILRCQNLKMGGISNPVIPAALSM
jgi:hypothetical protein